MMPNQRTPLTAEFFIANRKRLSEIAGSPSLAVLAAGRPPHRTADENYPFFANRNFYYLTGVSQEGALLLIWQENGQAQEMLFLPPVDAMTERWRGRMTRPQEAAHMSGISDIRKLDEFDAVIARFDQQKNTFWLDQSALDPGNVELRERLLKKGSEWQTEDLSILLTRLRMIKSQAELNCIREAAALTGRGIEAIGRRLMTRGGGELREQHLWAAFASALADEGLLAPAFPSIVAAGDNVFCLHYMTPYDVVAKDDLIQLDVGASANGLCADISRVLPASGRFTEQQRWLYQLVRDCQETAFATIRPGIVLADINEACRETAAAGLRQAGILLEDEDVKEYFWHNVSHHLGFDVHDVSNREALLAPGMVLTVEPGIYIPKIHLGMRIEDDVVVTEQGCELLSADLPREIDEIEAMLAQF